ncbi:MAG: hypothetical protein K5910_00775 [Bacteroidales bacterium]|nr:hypothetical protein [Bacteroidales bacterium]
MRRFLIFLTVFAVSLLALSSCKLDKEGSYQIFFEVEAFINDETTREAIKDYFTENYLQESHSISFYGKHYDACVKAEAFFQEGRNRVDGEFILSCITQEDEYVQLFGVLSGKDGKELVDFVYWDLSLKEQLAAQ